MCRSLCHLLHSTYDLLITDGVSVYLELAYSVDDFVDLIEDESLTNT